MEKVFNLPIILFCLAMIKPVIHLHIKAEEIDGKDDRRVFYDQRQTGKFNLHLTIKDVAIIEMNQNEFEDDSINDEDYYYDENDLTVKPYPSWVTKPSEESTSINPLNNMIKTNSTNRPTFFPYLSQTPLLPIIIPISALTTTRAPNVSFTTSNLIKADYETLVSSNSTSNNTNRTKISSNEQIILSNTTTIDIIPPSVVNNINTTVEAITSTNSNLAQTRELPVLHPRQRHPLLSTLLERPTVTELSSMLRKGNINSDYKLLNFKTNQISKPRGYTFPFRFINNERRCRSGSFLDEAGTCRKKRTSSLLRKLFKILESLPLHDQEPADETT